MCSDQFLLTLSVLLSSWRNFHLFHIPPLQTFRDGMDFYFVSKNQALRFIEFLNGNVPTKMKYSRKLVSADKKDNTANFKHNFLVDIVPICKVRH